MTKTEDNPMHLKTREPSRLRQAPRCLARTRRGTPCQSPAVAGTTRCRMHGGAAGSDAPKGRRNGKYRHGGFTTEAIDERRRLAALIRDSRDLLSRLRYTKRTYTLKTRSPADELEEDEAPRSARFSDQCRP